MKNPFKHFFMRNRKEKMEESEKEYLLCCDFGYDITSPIPSVEPVHSNSHCLVPAVVGTSAELFPGERDEAAEFISYICQNQLYTRNSLFASIFEKYFRIQSFL